MKQLVRWGILVTFVVMVILYIILSKPASDKYSYEAYRKANHIPVASCTLQANGDSGGPIKCKETGKLPTRAQINVWEGYVLWVSCKEYKVDVACKELND